MKAEHEARVERVTGIDPGKKAHVLTYGAAVGDHASPLSFEQVASSLFPRRYPAEPRAIELGMVNSPWRDRDAGFWAVELENLQSQFARKLRERMARDGVDHLAVFGLAPQPLLVVLGALLTDIPSAEVSQLRREPPGWGLRDRGDAERFAVHAPAETSGPPSLVLALSATVTDDRIHRAVGSRASIWRVTVDTPHNDIMQARGQLRSFRQQLRGLLDQIKAVHGQLTTLHVFPAMPVSCAIELGRVRMPKADMSWRLYDQLESRGFVPVIEIDGTHMSAVQNAGGSHVAVG